MNKCRTASTFPSLRLITAAVTVLLITGGYAYAADPQPYTVTIDKTGNTELDQIITDASTLISLGKEAPVGSFALVARARGDVERFMTGLQSLGYYKGKVGSRIAGRALDDPGLYDTIDYAPAQPPIAVKVSIAPGPQFHFRHIEIQGTVPEQAQSWLALKPQTPARATEALAARGRLLDALRDAGYALAKVAEPTATLATDADALDLRYHVETGSRVVLGEITIIGLKKVKEAFVRRRLLVSSGEQFNPTAIEKARLDLNSTGVFSAVQAKVADHLDNQGRLPITFVVTERKRHATSLGAAYSTDLGGSFTTTWQHRNLAGNAEQLNLTGGVNQLGGNSTTGIGYNLLAAFIKPDFLSRDQSLHASIGALKQSLIAYDQAAIMGDVLLSRKLDSHWRGSLGVALEQTHIIQAGVARDYTLLSLPTTVKYDSTNNLLDPIQGSLMSVSFTPMHSLAGAQTNPFVIMQVSGSTYLDLGKSGRSILALRGLVGDIQGAKVFSLPPDERFYAGGSATVRGYKYQSIGPQFADGIPQGGTAIMTGTVEFRQRILDDYGMAVFADAGQVSTSEQFLSGTWRIGAGIGARYYTAFGPLRVDVALPLNSQSNSGSFELYIGLGQAF
ncbi:MAG: BamA/TamA family outer membrane protein [Methylovulum sp.]|nr:BamA/TamA family outer membrane protein [Methylovulum sp.]